MVGEDSGLGRDNIFAIKSYGGRGRGRKKQHNAACCSGGVTDIAGLSVNHCVHTKECTKECDKSDALWRRRPSFHYIRVDRAFILKDLNKSASNPSNA